MVEQGDLEFEKAWKRKVDDSFLDVKAYFIPKDDLIHLKKYFKKEIDIKDIKRLKQSVGKMKK